MLWRVIPILLILVLMSLVTNGGVAQAAVPVQPSSVPGIGLSPAIQDKILGPTEKTTSFSVLLSNENDIPVTFSLSSTDFTSLNQTGGLTFMGSDSRAVTNGHGLSNIVRLDAKLVTLQPRQSRTITARVDDVSTLSPGGHYTAILAQALPDGSAVTGNRVAINQVVSSLIFLETAGQGTKTLELLKPRLEKLSFTLPRSINLVFKATGNTQTVARGLVGVSRNDRDLATGIINENSSLLLPGSTRLLPVRLNQIERPLWPGVYQLSVQYRYEGSVGVSTYQTSFVYVNLPFTAGLLVVMTGGLYLLWRQRRRLVAKVRRRQPVAVPESRTIVVRNRSDAGAQVAVKTPQKRLLRSRKKRRIIQ